MKSKFFLRRQAGVTLIELMITIAVAAILIGVGIPSLRNMVLENRRASAVNDLIATLHLARGTAQMEGRAVFVCARNGNSCTNSANWDGGWLAIRDDNGNGSADPGELVLAQSGGTPDGISMSSSNAAGLRFQRNRGIFPTTFSVCVDGADASRGRDIVVGPTGYPRLANPSATCP